MARRSSNPDQNPTLRGRRLAMELLRRREATGLTREEVARQLEWSPSTLFRIETGRSRPQPGNVRMLLELYGVTGPERDGLIQLTREARQPNVLALSDHVRAEQVKLDFPDDAGDARLTGLAGREVTGFLGLAGAGPVRAVPGEGARGEDL